MQSKLEIFQSWVDALSPCAIVSNFMQQDVGWIPPFNFSKMAVEGMKRFCLERRINRKVTFKMGRTERVQLY